MQATAVLKRSTAPQCDKEEENTSMKLKRIAAFLTAAAAALSFAACGAKSPDKNQTQPGASAVQKGTLRKITNERPDGVYILDQTHSRQLLCYIDYETETEVPLCAAPNCAHSGPECTAWADPYTVMEQPRVLNDTTLLQLRSQRRTSQEFDDPRMVAWTMGRDGSEPKQVLNAEETQQMGIPEYTDGEYVYAIRNTGEKDENGFLIEELQNTELVKAKADSWTDQQPILSFGQGHYVWILASDGNSLVVEDLDMGQRMELVRELRRNLAAPGLSPEQIDRYNREYEQKLRQLPPSVQTIRRVDVTTGETTELFSRPLAPGEGWLLPNACGRVFWWEQKYRELGWVKYTGETGTTTIRWPEDIPSQNYDAWEALELGGKLRLEATFYQQGSSTDATYLLDMDTGEVTEMKLWVNVGGQKTRPDVLAETPKGLLVIFEVWPDARPGEADKRIGFISMEDCLAGERNFKEIDRTAVR